MLSGAFRTAFRTPFRTAPCAASRASSRSAFRSAFRATSHAVYTTSTSCTTSRTDTGAYGGALPAPYDPPNAEASEAKEEVRGAEEKVREAKQEVREAEEKVEKAEEKVEKAKQEVKEAKQEVKEAEEKVKEAKQEVKEAEEKVGKAEEKVREAKGTGAQEDDARALLHDARASLHDARRLLDGALGSQESAKRLLDVAIESLEGATKNLHAREQHLTHLIAADDTLPAKGSHDVERLTANVAPPSIEENATTLHDRQALHATIVNALGPGVPTRFSSTDLADALPDARRLRADQLLFSSNFKPQLVQRDDALRKFGAVLEASSSPRTPVGFTVARPGSGKSAFLEALVTSSLAVEGVDVSGRVDFADGPAKQELIETLKSKRAVMIPVTFNNDTCVSDRKWPSQLRDRSLVEARAAWLLVVRILFAFYSAPGTSFGAFSDALASIPALTDVRHLADGAVLHSVLKLISHMCNTPSTPAGDAGGDSGVETDPSRYPMVVVLVDELVRGEDRVRPGNPTASNPTASDCRLYFATQHVRANEDYRLGNVRFVFTSLQPVFDREALVPKTESESPIHWLPLPPLTLENRFVPPTALLETEQGRLLLGLMSPAQAEFAMSGFVAWAGGHPRGLEHLLEVIVGRCWITHVRSSSVVTDTVLHRAQVRLGGSSTTGIPFDEVGWLLGKSILGQTVTLHQTCSAVCGSDGPRTVLSVWGMEVSDDTSIPWVLNPLAKNISREFVPHLASETIWVWAQGSAAHADSCTMPDGDWCAIGILAEQAVELLKISPATEDAPQPWAAAELLVARWWVMALASMGILNEDTLELDQLLRGYSLLSDPATGAGAGGAAAGGAAAGGAAAGVPHTLSTLHVHRPLTAPKLARADKQISPAGKNSKPNPTVLLDASPGTVILCARGEPGMDVLVVVEVSGGRSTAKRKGLLAIQVKHSHPASSTKLSQAGVDKAAGLVNKALKRVRAASGPFPMPDDCSADGSAATAEAGLDVDPADVVLVFTSFGDSAARLLKPSFPGPVYASKTADVATKALGPTWELLAAARSSVQLPRTDSDSDDESEE